MIGGVILIAGWWWMSEGSDESASTPRVQAAVLPNGFAVLADRRLRELDRDNALQHEITLKHAAEVRLVGTRAGTGIGWRDGKKIKFALVDNEGNPEEVSTWGKRVTQLCDGAASNEHRFGIGWLESDGRVWFVHGPMGRTVDASDIEPTLAKVTWCGIASAEQDVALVWREGQKYGLNFCSEKQCSAYVAKVPLAKGDTLSGFGCVRDSCLFSTHDSSKKWRLYRVPESGRTLVVPLPDAAPDSRVDVVGVGARAFAVGYVATDGRATVRRVATDGSFTDVWHFDDQRETPAIRWAGNRLFVAFTNVSHTIDMPR